MNRLFLLFVLLGFNTETHAESVSDEIAKTPITVNNLNQKATSLKVVLNNIKEEAQEEAANNEWFSLSPVGHLRGAFDGSDLISNISTMNEDLHLLELRQKQDLKADGHPHVMISGALEAQLTASKTSGQSTEHDVHLSKKELDVFINVSPAITAFTSLAYDDSPRLDVKPGQGSRLYMKRGFVTLGNLDKSSFYASLGQMYMPFGRYGGYLLSAPSPLIVGRTLGKGIVFGMHTKKADVGLYFMRSILPQHRFDLGFDLDVDGGVNLAVRPMDGMNLGLGYISNIQDAQNLRSVYPHDQADGTIRNNIPGWNAHLEWSLSEGRSLLAEYIMATKTLSYGPDHAHDDPNNRLASWHLEATQQWQGIGPSPQHVTLAYDHVKEGTPIDLPKNSWTLVWGTSFLKHTTTTVEIRHDQAFEGSSSSDKTQAIMQMGFYF